METEITLSEARKLAKYYGNLARKENETVQSEAEKRETWECLNYCRGIILKKGRKKIEKVEVKKELETA